MLQHVYERASHARYLTSTIIATDDERVYAAAKSFGARVRMTRADHLSGTDRVAEVASAENAEIVVNIQGDEPLIDPAAIDAAILPLVHEPDVIMGTLKKRIEDPREITDPNVVKVVTDHAGDAIYFSRCPIPFERGPIARSTPYFKHIGLYVYRRDFLLRYSDAAGRSAGTGGAAGAVARAGKRVPDPGGGNGIRIAGRGYAGGSGKGVADCSKPQLLTGE